MQSREFDNLMDGKDAKWADLMEEKNKPLMERLKSKTSVPDMEVLTVRKEIEKAEVPIPTAKRAEIDEFIAQQRRWGLKERAIRRKVQVKFNITVI